MKKVTLFLLSILLFACSQTNDSNTKNDKPKKSKTESATDKDLVNKPLSEEEIVSDIRKKFKEINEDKASYETKGKEITGESTEGGELKSYYQNDELKKVVASYFGEMGKTVEEYYFWKNNLFFVFTRQYSYDKPISVAGSKANKTDENRYYFHGGKLIRWLDPKKEKVSNSKFSQKETELLQQVKVLMKNLGNSKVGNLDTSKKDDEVAMKSLFSLSPVTIFDRTTFGLSQSEKNELLKKGESTSWKMIAKNKTKLAIECKAQSCDSELTLHYLKYKNNLGGVLFAQIVNGENVDLLSWKYSNETKALQEINILKKYTANDFVSKEDKLPDSYNAAMYYSFIDDQTIEVSPRTWKEKEFESREIIKKITLRWNGETFVEKVEKI